MRPADSAALARAIFDELSARHFIDFQSFIFKLDVTVNGTLDQESIILIEEETPDKLHDRSPLRRPLHVTPKGVIKSRPRRSDDY